MRRKPMAAEPTALPLNAALRRISLANDDVGVAVDALDQVVSDHPDEECTAILECIRDKLRLAKNEIEKALGVAHPTT